MSFGTTNTRKGSWQNTTQAAITCGATELASIINLYSETDLKPVFIKDNTHDNMHRSLGPDLLPTLLKHAKFRTYCSNLNEYIFSNI